MIDRIEIKHMRVFMRLIAERNLSTVGSQVGLTQQAISVHLKKLRDEFKDILFVRNGLGVTPTDFALELAIKFERILAEVDELHEGIDFDLHQLTRDYVIIANEYAQHAIIPTLVSRAISAAPNVTFKIFDFDPVRHKRRAFIWRSQYRHWF